MVARSTDWPERRRRFTVLVVAFLIGPAIVAASVTAGGLFLVGGPIVAAALLFAFVASTRRRRDRAHVSKGLVRTAATSAPDRRIEAFFDVLERTSIQTLRMLAVRPLDRPAQEEAHRVGRIAAERSGLIGLAEDAATRVTLGVRRAFTGTNFDPTMIGLAWRHEPMRPEDRERLVDTLTDAALGVIVRDLVDEATFDELIGPCTFLVGETAQPPPRAET